MKLLFDENLSPRLPPSLADCFPGSQHVYKIQLDHSDERLIWGYARENGFTIVSRDSDLVELAAVRGAPPKILALQFGNCTTQYVEISLRALAPQIKEFLLSDSGGDKVSMGYYVLMHTGPITSRNSRSGLAIRTLRNLDAAFEAERKGIDVHLVTHVLNSTLCLLVHLVEQHKKDKKALSSYQKMALIAPDVEAQIRIALDVPRMKVVRSDDCPDAYEFLNRMRNGIAHRRLNFDNESRQLNEVPIKMNDIKKVKKKPDSVFEITIWADELYNLCKRLGAHIQALDLPANSA